MFLPEFMLICGRMQSRSVELIVFSYEVIGRAEINVQLRSIILINEVETKDW